MNFNLEAGVPKANGEGRIRIGGPNRQYAGGPERCMGGTRSPVAIKAFVGESYETVGPVVDIERNRVKGGMTLCDDVMDVANFDRNPRITERPPP